MWVLITVGVLQVLFIIERFLHALVSVFIPQGDGDAVKKLARRNVVATLFSNVVLLITFPIQIVSLVMEAIFSNATTGVSLFILFCVLSIVARSPSAFFAYFINTYNSGVGVMLNYVFVKPLEIISWCVVYLIPLYNSFTYWAKEALRIVFFDVLQVNVAVFSDIIENIMLLFGSFGISIGTWSSHVAQCALHQTYRQSIVGNASLANATLIPFTDPNMDCVGNDNFLLLDVMTPALYAQRLVGNLNELVAQSCSPALVPVNIALYPLLDYNLWMSLNSLFNGFVVHPIFALPLKTWRRCEYAFLEPDKFTTTEKTVMCVPDFSAWIQILKVAARHLGKLVDNWLNVGVLLVENSLGIVDKTCDGAPSVRSVWQDASAVLGDELPLQTIGLTESLYAVTNGISTVYQSAVQNTLPGVAIGNWPFQIEPRYGVAAVQHAQKFDADDTGARRTGMLGCRCMDGVDGISLACATVPYLIHHTESDEEYEAETVIRIRFNPSDAHRYLQHCSNVRIKVSSMRFSRKRFSFGGENGVDATYNDMFDVLGNSGASGFAAEPQTFSADAAIIVTPLCSLAADPACVELVSSCFPFCMGLHVAGSQAASVTLHSAHYWKNFVNVAQTDCGVLQDAEATFCSSPAVITSENWDLALNGVCELPDACIPSDYMVSSLPFGNIPLNDAFRKTQPTIRLAGQPFVATGDVMLFAEGDSVRIVRLYDNSRGDFTLQNEAIVMSESPDVPATRCQPSSESCHETAMLAGTIVLPPPDRLARQISQPVAVSEWGVHWAVNPDTTVLGNYLDLCNAQGGFGVTLNDAYAPARVWTLKAFRASTSGASSSEESSLVSYMSVPDWLNRDNDCRQEVNIQVTDLEFLNSENILVTVLRASPMNYDPATAVHSSYSYARYFLHPNLARCTHEAGESARFSCWRSEDKGMFQEAPVRAAEVQHRLGVLCPAIRRMPEVGALGAELSIASLVVLNIGLDILTVLPPVFATQNGLHELFKTRLSAVTFHNSLDSSGKRLLQIEPLIFSIDKSMFYVASSITKIGNLFASLHGYEYIKPQIIGTAKIVQHMSGEALLTGSLLGQLKSIAKMPSVKTFSSMQQSVTGMAAKPSVLRSIRGLVASQLQSFSFNVRVLRRMAMRTLRFMADQTFNLQTVAALFTSILYESFTDLDRSTLDGLRVQCDGLGNLLHTDNPWARTVRNGCLLVPDGIHAIYNIILIFVVEYPILSCACKMEGEGDFVEVLTATCMDSVMPTQYRHVLNTMRFSNTEDVDAFRESCVKFMDSSNQRLETAFDVMLGRLSRVTDSIGESLNYLFSFTGISEEGCDDHIMSPYVMSIVPEPLAYFQGCALTSDCGIRCQSSMDAFHAAEAALLLDKPSYESEREITMRSPFYNEELMLAGNNIAPFEILTVHELGSRTCVIICGALTHSENKCVFVAGLEPDDAKQIAMAYYCIPAHYLAAIDRFIMPAPLRLNVLPPTGVIKTLKPLTTRNVMAGHYEALFFTAVAEESTYHSAGVFYDGLFATLVEGRARTDSNPTSIDDMDLTTIIDTFVVPSTDAQQTSAFVFLRGTIHTVSDSHQLHCVRLEIDNSFNTDGAPSPTWSPFDSVHTQKCSDDEMALFQNSRLLVCIDPLCAQMMSLPHTTGHPIELIEVTYPAQPWEYLAITRRVIRTPDAASGFAGHLSRLFHSDPSLALYRTAGGRAVRNVRRFSSMTTLRNVGDSLSFDVLFTGGSTTDLTWLHSARVVLVDGGDTVSEVTDTEHLETMEIVVDCSVSNCIGCQTNPPQVHFMELQALCFEAQACALKKCVGTSVNMRKPLCNLGQVAASSLDTYRIALRTLWKVVARSVILAVEISESRRNVYEVGWLDEQVMQMSCQAKDVIVESVATLTSIAGMVSSLTVSTSDTWSRTARIDAATNANTVLITAAATRLTVNVALLPVLLNLAAWKVSSCNVNATAFVIQGLMQQEESDVVIRIGSQRLLPAVESGAGKCMVAEVDSKLNDLAREDEQVARFIENEANNQIGKFLKHAASTQFTVMYHPIHAGLAWMLGVVTGIEDLLQTIDYRNCKAPLALNDISSCVCGDKAYRIPDSRRATKGVANMWCTGPLLFSTAFGDDILVINPFTLDDILAQAGPRGYDAYIDCLSASSLSEGLCVSPATLARDYFANFGVDVLQVITRCRGNYNAKSWDAGALAIGLFPYSDWEAGKLTLHASLGENFQKMRRQMYIMTQQPYVSTIQLAPDRDTWLCLHSAALYVNWNHNCHTEAIQRVEGVAMLETYFKYEPVATADVSFASSDACEVFSGKLAAYNSENGAAFSSIIWTPGSSNTVGVAELHVRESSPNSNRLEYVRSYLSEYWEAYIRPLVANLSSYETPDDLDIDLWSAEGDILHQTVDCVVIGPYASADMRSTFAMPNGRTFPVPQYHRGSPNSRQFHAESTTGGSTTRIAIIDALRKESSERTGDVVREQAREHVNYLRNFFANENAFLCVCADDTQVRSLECCVQSSWKDLSDITFASSDILASEWNLYSDIIPNLLDAAIHSPALRNDIWTSQEYVPPHDVSFNNDERVDMLHAYVFDTNNPIREYSMDEVDTVLGSGHTLWDDCTALLSASFFSLPLSDGKVDADMYYDPTSETSDAFLHGMEPVVLEVLSKAREKFPFFWTHAHRYVPSESTWCESPQPKRYAEPLDVFESVEFDGVVFEEDEIRSHSVSSGSLYPASLGCHCGWSFSNGECRPLPEGEPCWSVSDAAELQGRWQELCQKTAYSSREDWFLMLEVLEHPNTDPVWKRVCGDNAPSVHWGLLDNTAKERWFNGETQFAARDFMDVLLTKGPGGLRYGLLGAEAHSMRDFFVSSPVVDKTHSRANFKYRHTVGQPVCVDGMAAWLESDLRKHFTDVFIPMAHTHHDSAISAYCSRWTVEYALLRAYEDAGVSEEILTAQRNRVADWRLRCNIQLQQISICLLRDVYSLVPATLPTPQCSFSSAEDPGCGALFYTTAACLVMCDGDFYDPCACGGVADCDRVIFSKSTCPAGRIWDARPFALSPEVRTSSLHWPDSIAANEGGTPEMDDTIVRDRADGIPMEDILDELRHLTAQKITETVEGSAPHAFCDDTLDYWPADAQHPVGYHPTTCCLRSDTNMRGFDAWMSQPEDAAEAYSIDPIRLRNMTQASTEFGAAHEICDVSAYGNRRLHLNPFYFESRWDALESADLHVPLQRTPRTNTEGMNVFGLNVAQESFSTPLMEGEPYLRHSAGLLRGYYKSPDAELAGKSTERWPLWTTDYTYGTLDTDSCTLPPLYECSDAVPCDTHSAVSLVCLRNAAGVGLCVEENTCFMHEHCQDGMLCAGNGRCVEPAISMRSVVDDEFEVMVSTTSPQCTESHFGMSRFEGVSDLADANGLCSFRSWNQYLNRTEGSTDVDRNLHAATTSSAEFSSVTSEGVLRQEAHPCDRSYEKLDDFKFCALHGTLSSGVTAQRGHALRTWDRESAFFCDMNRRQRTVTGFLDSYSDFGPGDVLRETLENTPANLARCTDFDVCPEVVFSVEDRVVTKGRHANRRAYTHNDHEQCGAIGYVYQETSAEATEVRCAVDRDTVPLLSILFQSDRLQPLPVVERTSTVGGTDLASLSGLLSNLRNYCPHAFGDAPETALTEFEATYLEMASPYNPREASAMTLRVNRMLHRVFGETRGFGDVDAYLTLSRCAGYVLLQLDTLRDSMISDYYKEDPQLPPTPGKSLYFFTQHTATQVPFLWFWQCVLLARETEGGSRTDWLTAADLALVCPNYNQDSLAQPTMRQRLMRAPYLFDVRGGPDDDVEGALLVAAVRSTITYAIDVLGLTNVEDIYCYGLRRDAHTCTALYPHVLDENTKGFAPCDGDNEAIDYLDGLGTDSPVWVHAGRDPGELVEAEDASEFSVRGALMRIIFGVDSDADVMALAYSMTYENLITNDIISEGFELDGEVPPDSVFFHGIHFTQLDRYLENPPPSPISLSPLSVDGRETLFTSTQIEWAQPDATCGRLFENSSDYDFFRVARNEHSWAGVAPSEACGTHNASQAVVTKEQALCLAIAVFQREVVNIDLFQTGNMHHVRQLSTQQTSAYLSSALDLSSQTNAFFLAKTFPCGDQGWNPTDVTNPQFQKLQECIQGKLSHDMSSRLPPRETLSLPLHADVLLKPFVLSVSEPPDSRYLSGLFSDELARAKIPQQICFKALERIQSINPYSATRFDIETGCDISHTTGSTWAVDYECARLPGMECRDAHPTYAAGRRTMPAFCAQNTNTMLLRRNTGSLVDTPELCERRFVAPPTCTQRHVTLFNSVGTAATDLHVTRPVDHVHVGLWSAASLEALLDKSERDETVAWRLLPTDIAGDGLLFKLREDSEGRVRMDVECVFLGEREPSCLRSAQRWLSTIHSRWAWQHTALAQYWQDTDIKTWSCPLQWLTAASGQSRHALSSPSWQRNERRFAHITGDYPRAHPTMQRLLSEIDMLEAGAFMSEVQLCAANSQDRLSCQGSAQYARALAWMRSSDWNVVELINPGTRCDAVLDWPSTPYRAFDGTEYSRGALPEHCNILDRVPSFAIRRAQRTLPRMGRATSTLDPGGVCHMGRLPRLTSKPVGNRGAVWDADGCRRHERQVICRYKTLRENQMAIEETEFLQQEDRPAVGARPRRKRCVNCDDHSTSSFVRGDLSKAKLSDGATRHLSTGVMTTVHPARQIAAHLRRNICPNTTGSCAELETLFDANAFTIEGFADSFLNRPTPQQANTSGVDSSVLWGRNWVWCDPHNASQPCAGSISRADWLNATKRPAMCAEAVYAAHQRETAPIQFCKVDTQTSQLCQSIATWNAVVKGALCMLNDLQDCPEMSHFYVPTVFSISNNEFTADTVKQFYQYENAAAYDAECVSATPASVVDSGWSNKNCLSIAVAPFRIVLEALRDTVLSIIQLMYYFALWMVKLLELIIAVVMNSDTSIRVSGFLERAETGFIVYAKLLLWQLNLILNIISDMLFELMVASEGLFRAIRDIAVGGCRAVNALVNIGYQVGCPASKVYLNIFTAPVIGDALRLVIPHADYAKHTQAVQEFISLCTDERSAVSVGSGCMQPHRCPGFQPPHPDQDPELPGCQIKETNADEAWEYSYMRCNCEAVFPAKTPTPQENQALPQPTRCWSTYSAFFGDTTPLSCQSQDTCSTSDGLNNVLCGDCPRVNAGRRVFGCDPVVKQCKCSVPDYSETSCFSNAECFKEGSATCRFIDVAAVQDVLSQASVPCQACSGITSCFIAPGREIGVCGCSLHNVRIATCPSTSHTQSVALPFSSLCLLDTSNNLLTSNTFEAQFAALTTTTCSNAYGAYCYMITHPNGVGVFSPIAHRAVLRRRLLAEDPRCEHSAGTITALGADLPECAFASISDAIDTAFKYDLSSVFQNYTMLRVLLARHTPLHRVLATVHDLSRAQRYLDNDDKGDLVVQVLSPWLPPQARRLHSMSDVLDSAQLRFEEMAQIHNSFADTILTAFRTDYVPLSDAQASAWVGQWPPRLVSDADGSCSVVPQIIQSFAYATNNLTLFYTALGRGTLPARPTTTLRDSWPLLKSSGGIAEFVPRRRPPEDIVVDLSLDAAQFVLDTFDVKDTFVFDFTHSATTTVVDSFRCNLENVQMCYEWRVTIGNGLIVVFLLYSLAFLVCQAFGLTSIVVFLVPLFVFFTLNLCYGYEWACFPLIPTCLLNDIVSTLNATIPPKIEPLPRALLRTGGSFTRTCSPEAIAATNIVPTACIVQCSDAPQKFTSYEAPLAWWLEELGLSLFVEDTVLPLLNFFDTSSMKYHLHQKRYAMSSDDNLILYRSCAVVTSYRLLPYLLIAGVAVAAVLSVTRFLLTFVYAFSTLVGAIFVEALT